MKQTTIRNEDLRITVPPRLPLGGQHVGVIETGVEVEHLPTGIKVFYGYHRSQMKNRAAALDMIEWALTSLQ